MPSVPSTPGGEKDASAGNNPILSAPTLSLPKGGGAVKGIDEKFAVSPATGTASVGVPLPLSPNRQGFTPSLSLSYDSGSGNGPFGLGWKLSLPSISRKTDKGLPRYVDADVFQFTGAEDLVPLIKDDGTPDAFDRDGFHVRRYRPRVEGGFARIERWTRPSDGDVHWRVTTPDNTTSFFGRALSARVADPADAARVFQWNLEEVRDDKGNVAVYEYKPEDGAGVDPRKPEEKPRLDRRSFAQTYLKRVLYGNRAPFVAGDWMFELVLDYGDQDDDAPSLDAPAPWAVRPDPFSMHRPAFEVRTWRRCRRALMYHHFDELGAGPTLVRSVALEYQADAPLSLVSTVTQTGYIRTGDAYTSQSLPPLSLTYTTAAPDGEVRDIRVDGGEAAPFPDGARHQWVDLDGEGIPGLLSDEDGAWFYRRNLGGGLLGAARPVAERPALAGTNPQLMDVDGDGRLDLVTVQDASAGYHLRDRDGQWAPFTPFPHRPLVPWNDPRVRFIDLDGDGRSDVLVTEDEVFRWHPSLGKDGFGPSETAPRAKDEEKGPVPLYFDETETLFLADMTGDGLTDMVRVRNGSICYWPNLGYGRFGPKVVMDAAPVFDGPERFHARRLRLADVDGAGPADIVYLGPDGADLYDNLSGNRFAARVRIPFPAVDDLSAVQVADVLGTGTACLVWSSPLPGDAGRAIRCMDLMGRKPFLLETEKNNMGAEKTLTYAPSTKFYLEDRAAGRRWATRLPFPVHVVQKVEVRERITGLRFASEYRYRHGFYDGDEREFRGFGYVEQRDTETFDAVVAGGGTNADPAHYQPPVLTKTWLHTGAYFEEETLFRAYAREYYAGDTHPQAAGLPETTVPAGLSGEERREACRALKGRTLRVEVYGLDGDPVKEPHPYAVTESAYALRKLQPHGANPYASFLVLPRETVSFHYERNPDDPRVGHELVLAVDAFGVSRRSAAVAYPRRTPAFPEQGVLSSVVSGIDVIHRPDETDWYRLNLPQESRAFELTGLTPPAGLFRPADVQTAFDAAAVLASERFPSGGLQKRLLKKSRNTYSADDLSAELPLGEVQSKALPWQSRTLALTRGQKDALFGDRFGDDLLAGEGGYVLAEDAWWIPSGRAEMDPARFYLPTAFHSPFGNIADVFYDAHALLIQRTESSRDPSLRNVSRADNDYRVLGPWRVTDPNGNRTAALFDALGLVSATAVMGKETESLGDTLDDPTARIEYDLTQWTRFGKPAYARALARETHRDPATRWQESWTYSDGMGRAVQAKAKADPDPASGTPRWAGTGRMVLNNKGNPVKKYEPFFSATSDYEGETAMVERGVTPVLHYDPTGRVVRTDFPDGTLSRVVFDPWRQEAWDPNDAVLESAWYARRGSPDPASPDAPADPDARAAWLAAKQAGTPAATHSDSLGRPFRAESDLGVGPEGVRRVLSTLTEQDVEGRPLSVTDPRNNAVMTYRLGTGADAVRAHDLAGRLLYQSGMDGGERRTISAADGRPLRLWAPPGFLFRHEYDPLRRPTAVFAQSGTASETVLEQVDYGEAGPDAAAHNLLGKPWRNHDGAGLAVTEDCDFKGNILRASRRLASDGTARPDWGDAVPLSDETFSVETEYDAMNRPVRVARRRGDSVAGETAPSYGDAGALRRVEVRLRGDATPRVFVQDIVHDAKGQRASILYGNGVRTTYAYDPETFRLKNLSTIRPSGESPLQNLSYVYDPAGNIVQIDDAAQPRVFFRNAVVEAKAQYTYDALYRLVSASGREHGGLGADRQWDEDQFPLMSLPLDNDLQALRRYTETYDYDDAGNIASMDHAAPGGNWTRAYSYAADSNRLLTASRPPRPGETPPPFDYDGRGNMTKMPHLPALTWDVQDRLASVDLMGGGQAWYQYDSGGQRSRKLWDHGDGLTEERFYLGGLEIYRRRRAGVLELERETFHVMDDKRRIALVETTIADAAAPAAGPDVRVRFQLDNHLGSACLEVDDGAQVITYEEYHPYGTTAYRSSAPEVAAKRYRYTGMERDDETGLAYHTARYYAPWLGRWISCDPSGTDDGLNVFAYARDHPLNFVDTNGRFIVLIALVAVVVIAAVAGLAFNPSPTEHQEPGHVATQEEQADFHRRQRDADLGTIRTTAIVASLGSGLVTSVAADGVVAGTGAVLREIPRGLVIGTAAVGTADLVDPSGTTGTVVTVALATGVVPTGRGRGRGTGGGRGGSGRTARISPIDPAPAPEASPSAAPAETAPVETAPPPAEAPITPPPEVTANPEEYLPSRAEQIRLQIVEALGLSTVPANRLTVAVARPNLPGGEVMDVIEVTTPEAYEAIASGRVQLEPWETLGSPRARVEGFNLHTEIMAALDSNLFGGNGGLVGTSRPACDDCGGRFFFDMLPGWTHVNPLPGADYAASPQDWYTEDRFADLIRRLAGSSD